MSFSKKKFKNFSRSHFSNRPHWPIMVQYPTNNALALSTPMPVPYSKPVPCLAVNWKLSVHMEGTTKAKYWLGNIFTIFEQTLYKNNSNSKLKAANICRRKLYVVSTVHFKESSWEGIHFLLIFTRVQHVCNLTSDLLIPARHSLKSMKIDAFLQKFIQHILCKGKKVTFWPHPTNVYFVPGKLWKW